MSRGLVSMAIVMLLVAGGLTFGPGGGHQEEEDGDPRSCEARNDVPENGVYEAENGMGVGGDGGDEAGSAGGTRTLMLYDDFERQDLGPDWTVNSQGGVAQITNATYSSYNRSMSLNGGVVSATSAALNCSNISWLHLSFWVRRGGPFAGSDIPEAGEDLRVEFENATGVWENATMYVGGGFGGQTYYYSSYLPETSFHDAFRLRFRTTGGTPNYDFWHIDDVHVSYHRPEPYEFSLTPWSSEKYGGPGETADHRLTVENTGLNDDSYDISYQGSYDVVFRDGEDTRNIACVSADSGGTAVFIVRVSIPADAVSGQEEYALLRLSSQNESGVLNSTSLRTTNVEGLIMVGLVDHPAFHNVSYWYGGMTNNPQSFSPVFAGDPEGGFYSRVICHLSDGALSDVDVLLLPDTGVPDRDLDNVTDWLGPGRGIVMMDTAVCFGAHTGLLFPQGLNKGGGYGLYWDDRGGSDDQMVVLDHNVTEDYGLGWIGGSEYGCTQYFLDELPDDAAILTMREHTDSKVYAAARDVPSGGKVVGLGAFRSPPPHLEEMVRDAAGWCTLPAQDHGVQLLALPSRSHGNANSTVNYSLELRNLGTEDDTYDLNLSGRWDIVVRDKWDTHDVESADVDSRSMVELIARVTIPADASKKESCVNVVRADSRGSPGLSDPASVNTTHSAGYVVVGVYDHASNNDVSYFQGPMGNYYAQYFETLAGDVYDRFYPVVLGDMTPGDLRGIEVLLLPDNGVPDHLLNYVDTWFGEGKGMVLVNGAAAYGCYSGYLFPGAQGTGGYGAYWSAESSMWSQMPVGRNGITVNYTIGATCYSAPYGAQYNRAVFDQGTFPLTVDRDDHDAVYVAARVDGSGGKVVGLGPFTDYYPGLENMVMNAVEWSQGPQEELGMVLMPPSSEAYARKYVANGYHFMEVYNIGWKDDTYDLTWSDGWPLTFLNGGMTTAIDKIKVNSGKRGKFVAQVRVADEAQWGGVGWNVIKAQSKKDKDLNSTATLTTWNTEGYIAVGVYRDVDPGSVYYYTGHMDPGCPGYYIDAVGSDPAGRFMAVPLDTLTSYTLAPLDVLLLPDNAVPSGSLSNVLNWFIKGRGIVLVDNAVCYGAFSGLLFPDAQGSGGYGEYWDEDSLGLQKVLADHPITENYSVGAELWCDEGGVQLYEGRLPDDARVLTACAMDASRIYTAARDVPGYGRLVALGSMSFPPFDSYNLIHEAIEWTVQPPTLRAIVNDLAPSTVLQGQRNVTMASIFLEGMYENVTVDNITVHFPLSSHEPSLETAYLARDVNQNADLDEADEILYSGGFAEGPMVVQTGLLLKPMERAYFILVYDVAGNAKIGKRLGFAVGRDDFGVAPEVLLPLPSSGSGDTRVEERTDLLRVRITNMTPPEIERGVRNLPLLMVELSALTGDVTVRKISLDLEGTVRHRDLKSTGLYLDADGNGYFQPKYDELVCEGKLNGTYLNFTDMKLKVNVTPVTNLFAVFHISPRAVVGRTMGLRVDHEAFDLKSPDVVNWFQVHWGHLGTFVDTTPPAPPANLTIVKAHNGSVVFRWDDNSESDLAGYSIYNCTNLTVGDWTGPINATPLLEPGFNRTGLASNTTFYFMVTALDEFSQESEPSNVVEAFFEAYHDPEVLDPPDGVVIREDAVSTPFSVLDWFDDEDGQALQYRVEGMRRLDVSIDPSDGVVTVTPGKDWSGNEVLTFFASDGKAEVYHHIRVTVTPVNDPPGPLTVVSPGDGLSYWHGTPMDLLVRCEDPDVPYGDELAWLWNSSLDGILGNQNDTGGVLLTLGQHIIHVTVEDAQGERSEAWLTITVRPTPGDDTDGDGIPDDWEMDHGLDPYDPSDALEDPDGDGMTLLDDYLEETGEPAVDGRPTADPSTDVVGVPAGRGLAGDVGAVAGLTALLILLALLASLFFRGKGTQRRGKTRRPKRGKRDRGRRTNGPKGERTGPGGGRRPPPPRGRPQGRQRERDRRGRQSGRRADPKRRGKESGRATGGGRGRGDSPGRRRP